MTALETAPPVSGRELMRPVAAGPLGPEIIGVGFGFDIPVDLHLHAELDPASLGEGDGFMLMTQSLPASITDLVDLLVPELQRRGRFRTEYDSHTLRGHFFS